jgi:hypothetical protein
VNFYSLYVFFITLSALEFSKEITAQIAAGIQPIKVICKIKQMIDVTILPQKRKIRKEKNAINVIIYYYVVW